MTPENTLFELPDDQDHIFKARDHLPLVLYFYPRDNTPGCSIEGQEFTTLQGEYKKLGYEIAGVSRNSVESHQKFRIKRKLTFFILHKHLLDHPKAIAYYPPSLLDGGLKTLSYY
ncbi:MAG: hypothetical protein DI620_01540 [Haemophilus parainfluenzae]|nr:MAG: hypothetical protein DI620_01540 [Haemophilus parainfluenzae]